MTIIEVTEPQIAAGKMSSYDGCPWYYAISEKVLKYIKVEVFERRVSFLYHGTEVSRTTIPEAMTAWIRDFDSGRKVAVTSFEIDIEQELLRQ